MKCVRTKYLQYPKTVLSPSLAPPPPPNTSQTPRSIETIFVCWYSSAPTDLFLSDKHYLCRIAPHRRIYLNDKVSFITRKQNKKQKIQNTELKKALCTTCTNLFVCLICFAASNPNTHQHIRTSTYCWSKRWKTKDRVFGTSILWSVAKIVQLQYWLKRGRRASA